MQATDIKGKVPSAGNGQDLRQALSFQAKGTVSFQSLAWLIPGESPRLTTGSLGTSLRRAAAIVISDPERQVLLARRTRMLDEYAGVWSFPSTFIDADTPDGQIQAVIAAKVNSWFGLTLPSMKLLRVRHGIRPAWRLDMYLCGSVGWQIPLLRTAKYDAVQWVDGPAFFSQFNPITLGDCSKAYLEYVDEHGNAWSVEQDTGCSGSTRQATGSDPPRPCRTMATSATLRVSVPGRHN